MKEVKGLSKDLLKVLLEVLSEVLGILGTLVTGVIFLTRLFNSSTNSIEYGINGLEEQSKRNVYVSLQNSIIEIFLAFF